MKSYPSIGTAFDPSLVYHVFDKRDGSNIRAEWSAKRGFYKFGCRTRLLGEDDLQLGASIGIIRRTFADALAARFARRRWDRAVAFFEYVGPQSFAGSHHDAPDAMEAVLIDVAPHQRGLLPPGELIELAEGLPMPALLHHGRVDDAFVAAVRESRLPGMGFEGVVGKGPFSRREGGPVQFKLKTQAWLDRLRTICRGDDALFERLR